MQVKGKFHCPFCEGDTPVRFKKPGFLKPVDFGVTCQMCESRFLLRMFWTKEAKSKGKLNQHAKPLWLSPVAKEIAKEQAEERAAAQNKKIAEKAAEEVKVDIKAEA